MALAGVNDVYASGSQLLKAFLGLDIAASQLYRVTNYLGEQITTDLAQPVEHPPLADDELIYGSVDGSMILTDSGWQEVKVGRVFTSEARIEAGQKGESQTRFRLSSSTYCAHLGEHTDFTPLFEASLGLHKSQPERLVLLSDGGVWIQNYFGQHYPKATHILDYYHAVEHLAEWVRVQFKGSKLGIQWLDRQRDNLLSNGVGDVIDELQTLSNLSRESGACRDKLVGYYKRNRDRMQYGTYRMRGLQIGSGAIEAAHRTVIQCRMKRSGQRWSDAGSQAMLNLRVASKSGRWQLVKDRLNSV
jgi:hypothetical protein